MKIEINTKPKTLRKLHSYISLVFCFFLMFYLSTGFLLNHPDWFEAESSSTISTYYLDDSESSLTHILSAQKINLTESGIRLLLANEEFELKGPGWSKFLTLESNTLEVESISYGLLATLNDLHKNRHAHVSWVLISDFFLFITFIMCITGIWISLKNTKKKKENIKIFLMGGLGLFLFLFFIPMANAEDEINNILSNDTLVALEASIDIRQFDTKTEKPYVALFSKNRRSEYKTHIVLKERYKWVKDLKTFWRKVARNDRSLVDARSGATRKPGIFNHDFTIVLGPNESLSDVVFYLEVVREKGKREMLTLEKITSSETSCIDGNKEIEKFCIKQNSSASFD